MRARVLSQRSGPLGDHESVLSARALADCCWLTSCLLDIWFAWLLSVKIFVVVITLQVALLRASLAACDQLASGADDDTLGDDRRRLWGRPSGGCEWEAGRLVASGWPGGLLGSSHPTGGRLNTITREPDSRRSVPASARRSSNEEQVACVPANNGSRVSVCLVPSLSRSLSLSHPLAPSVCLLMQTFKIL
jgi:hypothetical protein